MQNTALFVRARGNRKPSLNVFTPTDQAVVGDKKRRRSKETSDSKLILDPPKRDLTTTTAVMVYHKPANVITSHTGQVHPPSPKVEGTHDDFAIQSRRMTIFESILVGDIICTENVERPADIVNDQTRNEIFKKIQGLTPETQNRKVAQLLGWHPELKIHPVGRLDADTSGLLLLTNDGTLVHHITNPLKYPTSSPKSDVNDNTDNANSNKVVTKSYTALVMGRLNSTQLSLLRNGVDIGSKYGGMTNPALVDVLDHPTPKSTLVNITISEGRNRQIRRMFHAVQSGVMKLHRTKIGFLTLSSNYTVTENNHNLQKESADWKEASISAPSSDKSSSHLSTRREDTVLKENGWRQLSSYEIKQLLGYSPRSLKISSVASSTASSKKRTRNRRST